ncbi:MAG TPA: DUF4124 domain-containing protein [Burkholderiales bacterium]|nr:DUF4124 domain-containing protein [Burkholderiales bacterium]
MRRTALALLFAANAAAAQVYKWVDADGVTHYGNHPPAGVAAQPVGDRMNVYQPDAPLDDAIGTARIEQRKKLREELSSPPPPPAQPAADEGEDDGGGAGGPHLVQRPAPTWHSNTNIGYPSANNPGTRASPPR